MRDYFVDGTNGTTMYTEFKEDVTIYLWVNLWGRFIWVWYAIPDGELLRTLTH